MQDQTDGFSRRKVLAALGAAGIIGASASTAAADEVGIGGGPMSDELSHLNVEVYSGDESEIPEPGVAGRYFHVESGGTLWNHGDLLEDTGDSWSKVDLGVDSLESESLHTGELNNTVRPEKFGAEGDGETDDTQAIQDAVDSAEGGKTLKFTSGNIYRITDTIDIDVADVRSVVGDNSRLFIDGDFTALSFEGTHDGTASPETTTETTEADEMNPGVYNLRIHGPNRVDEGELEGVGIEWTRTFKFNIRDCDLYNLRTALLVFGNTRNEIITDNHIWHCEDYGMHFEAGEHHQFIFNNNHVSYCDIAFYSQSAHIDDLEMLGNGLESSAVPEDPTNLIRHDDSFDGGNTESESPRLNGFQIVGNTIEDHNDLTDSIIHLDGSTQDSAGGNALQDGNITGNQFTRTNADCIRMTLPRQVSITGNTARDIGGDFVEVDRGRDMAVNGNSVEEIGGDFFVMEDTETVTVNNNAGRNIGGHLVSNPYSPSRCHYTVVGNAFRGVDGYILSTDGVHRGPMTCSHNQVHDAGGLVHVFNENQSFTQQMTIESNGIDIDRDDDQPIVHFDGQSVQNVTIERNVLRADETGADWIIEIDSDTSVDRGRVAGNQLRSDGADEGGIRLTDDCSKLFVVGNSVEVDGTGYDLPDEDQGNIVIRENLS